MSGPDLNSRLRLYRARAPGDRSGVRVLRADGLRPGRSDRKPSPGLLRGTRERAGAGVRRVAAGAGAEVVVKVTVLCFGYANNVLYMARDPSFKRFFFFFFYF